MELKFWCKKLLKSVLVGTFQKFMEDVSYENYEWASRFFCFLHYDKLFNSVSTNFEVTSYLK